MAVTTALEFLLVSNDYQTLTAVAGGLQQIGASFDFVPTSEAGRDFIGRRKVDGIIVDMDVPGAQDLILSIRQGTTSNRGTAVFTCLPSGNKSSAAVATGTTFLLPQPLTPESVASQVSAARNSMVQNRRHFFRYPLTLPVHLTSNGAEQRAMMTNLGEGGMAVYTVKLDELPRIIEFVFELRSGDSIAGKGSIAWANNDGMLGIKFLFLRGQGEETLQKWLRERQSRTSEDSGPSNYRRSPENRAARRCRCRPRSGPRRLQRLPHALERRRPRHSQPEASQIRVRETTSAGARSSE